MHPSIHLVIFTLDGQPYALELAKVHRVVRAIEVTPLPGAPAVILGVVNVQGELVAVVNLHRRFGLPEHEMSPTDQFIIANLTTRGSTRRIALVVDAVKGISVITEQNIREGAEIVSGLEYVQGVAKLADDLIFIYDLEHCLSLPEERMLDDALAEMGRS